MFPMPLYWPPPPRSIDWFHNSPLNVHTAPRGCSNTRTDKQTVLLLWNSTTLPLTFFCLFCSQSLDSVRHFLRWRPHIVLTQTETPYSLFTPSFVLIFANITDLPQNVPPMVEKTKWRPYSISYLQIYDICPYLHTSVCYILWSPPVFLNTFCLPHIYAFSFECRRCKAQNIYSSHSTHSKNLRN